MLIKFNYFKMGLIIFYLIGCIIAWQFSKDETNTSDQSTPATKKYTAIALSWVTVAKYLYEMFANRL